MPAEAADVPNPATTFDGQLVRLLDDIRPAPEWGAMAVTEYVRRVMQFLLEYPFPDGPPANDVLKSVFRQLAQALKRHRHPSETVTEYLKSFRALAGSELPSDFSNAGSVGPRPVVYEAVTGLNPEAPEDPAEWGMYRVTGDEDRQLTDFCLFLDEHQRVEDELEPTERFVGRFLQGRDERRFEIDAAAYANDSQFRAALYEAGGPKIQIIAKLDDIRNAVAGVSTPVRTTTTTSFGWNQAGDQYRTPGGVVTAAGFRPYAPADVRVDLGRTERARYLGLRPPDPDEIARLKRHVVDDFLAVQAPPVTRTLLATVALAVLFRFAGAANKFTVWLQGRTGVGKSFAAKLAANFYGEFGVGDSGRFQGWNSTSNSIQREGYYFRDAVYLVDDYKPELVRHTDVVRILQAYADGAARGRLRADGTPSLSREIRGQLISTGEDVPEHSASALARTVVVPVPRTDPDYGRADRCVRVSAGYPALTADFLRFTLVGGWTERFRDEVARERVTFHRGIAGVPNDMRIAANFALLAAAFRAVADYLSDGWPAAADVAEEYVSGDLIGLRNATVRGAREQSAGEVFLATLAGLIQHHHVQIQGWDRHSQISSSIPEVGVFRRSTSETARPAFALNIPLCLAAVNDTLGRQKRPHVVVSPRTLLEELRADGRLLGADHRPLSSGVSGGAGVQLRIGGSNVRCVLIAPSTLLGESTENQSGTGGPTVPRVDLQRLQHRTGDRPNGAAL